MKPDEIVDRDRVLAMAAQAYKAKCWDDAERLCRRALDLDADCVPAQVTLGVLCCKLGRFLEAAEFLDSALRQDPEIFEALMWRSTVARKTNDSIGALDFAQRAVKLQETNFQAHNNLGLIFLDAGFPTEALESLKRAHSLNPGRAATLHNLGIAHMQLSQPALGLSLLLQAEALDASSVDRLISIATAYSELGRPLEAIKTAERAAALDPSSSEAQLCLAGSLLDIGDVSKAHQHLGEAIALDQTGKNVYSIAAKLQQMGKGDEANASYRKEIELRPNQGLVYSSLIHNMKVSETDQVLIDKMLDLIRNPRFSPKDLAALHYALGKAFGDLGQYSESMHHYEEANGLELQMRRVCAAFDAASYRRSHDRMMAVCDANRQRIQGGSGNSSHLPVFIVGMMRSGTTLVEQILSRHQRFSAAGELSFWPQNAHRVFEESPTNIAEEYLRILRSFGADALRVSDKMPRNYESIGPICSIFPNAKIIHIVRNPIDTCLSIFITPNKVAVEYAHVKRNIACAYREYQRLMEYWKSGLAVESLYEIQYEALVDDPKVVIRGLVEFCGLEWDDACLSPENNDKRVSTPSLWQVRQPINPSSIGRWRKYEAWIPEFLELGGAPDRAQARS
jgi:tetratricopeptide (TPR) repeat protein